MNTLEGWPYAVRCMITCAQRLADVRGHAETTAAHVSDFLYAMKPVRPLVAATLTPAVVESALLVEKIKRREHPGLETAIIQLTELIDRTTARSEGSVAAPRLSGALSGALAGVLANGTLETHLTMACLDDDAVAFATAALHEGQELLLPAAPPEQA